MDFVNSKEKRQPETIIYKTVSWWQSPLLQFLSGLAIVGATALLRYRSSIRKRLKQMEKRLERGLIYRDTSSTSNPSIRCLELDPSFLKQQLQDDATSFRMMSMGQYLSQLRVIRFDDDDDDNNNQEIPDILKREFQACLGAYLLSTMGPLIGPAVLPMLGISKVDSWLTALAGNIASWLAAHLLMTKIQANDKASDFDVAAAIPFTVGEIVNLTNINQKMTSYGSSGDVTPLEKLKRGETAYSISFDHGDSTAEDETGGGTEENDTCNGSHNDEELVPNPFIVETHMEHAIAKMEAKLQLKDDDQFNPNDRSFPSPTPLNERLLPDLHLGWGDTKCTHTKREILLNRLVSVLLNKLSYNYYLIETRVSSESFFVVKVNDKRCQFPDELIQALVNSNHTIEICPRSSVTTFGLAVCVKEKDGGFTNIPLGLFLRAGLEGQNGDPLMFIGNHGGMDLSIRGPLIDAIIQNKPQTTAKCDVQFYVSIDGMCGWNSNHNPQVPWKQQVSTAPIYTRTQALAAVRTTGLVAVTFNSIATEMNLPFGGYGVLGVCNDSAGLVDTAIRGETNLYPLISTDRFLWHTLRRLVRLQASLQQAQAESSTTHNLQLLLEDIQNLIRAASTMESDIHSSPSRLTSAKRRYDACYPISIFRLTAKSKQMLQTEVEQYQQYIFT
jgi:hypothetical protein